MCDALVRVSHGAGSRKVTRLQLSYLKSGRADELVNLAIQVAATGEALPGGRKPVLPRDDISLGSATVLEEDEPPGRL